MDKYNHPLILSYTGEFGTYHKIRTFNLIERSLSEKYEIMSLQWVTLERAWFGEPNGFCVKVYRHGWDYDDDTRRLHQMFLSVVTPFVDKNLEDYL